MGFVQTLTRLRHWRCWGAPSGPGLALPRGHLRSGRPLPPGPGPPRPSQQRPELRPLLVTLPLGFGVIVGTVGGDTYLAGLHRPERLGAEAVPSTRRAPGQGRNLAVPTKPAVPLRELGAGWAAPSPRGRRCHGDGPRAPAGPQHCGRGPGAGAAHSWRSRRRTDAQARGGGAETGRTTEQRGWGAL